MLLDLNEHQSHIKNRKLHSIFIGGGTPSLFSANAIDKLLTGIHKQLEIVDNLEITLEANPGVIDQKQFRGFSQAGINRLSLGVQSFQENKLRALGRIHNGKEAQQAVDIVRKAGIENFNIDLMFALPDQSIDEALNDLHIAQSLAPTHISWYQLTIEPHTAFYYRPPTLPEDKIIWQMQQLGKKFLAEHNYQQYEVSAYSQSNYQCRHNNNYWEFGDYIGIGAGAHSKITDPKTHTIWRAWKSKNPRDYLNFNTPFTAEQKIVVSNELAFEFMLNALRLNRPTTFEQFEQRTGLDFASILAQINQAQTLKLLRVNKNKKTFQTTARGKRFLNDLIELFI